ncbi:hypothetical protein Scep_004822 [Stephania cephalantha]|uniref:Uncharacterized protein n=1 Tax=Stephania cephalantha TaxID=152367 RepID=A0AAP0KT49_9MAGN
MNDFDSCSQPQLIWNIQFSPFHEFGLFKFFTSFLFPMCFGQFELPFSHTFLILQFFDDYNKATQE